MRALKWSCMCRGACHYGNPKPETHCSRNADFDSVYVQFLQQSGVMSHAVSKPHLRGIGSDLEFDVVVADAEMDDAISKAVIGEAQGTQSSASLVLCVPICQVSWCCSVYVAVVD